VTALLECFSCTNFKFCIAIEFSVAPIWLLTDIPIADIKFY